MNPTAGGAHLIRELYESITKDLAEVLTRTGEACTEKLLDRFRDARRVFFTGQGRSGAMARAAAIRFAHLRDGVYLVGQPSVPPIGRGDLLVACSGRGTTASVCLHARTAKTARANVVAITTAPEGELTALADLTIVLPASRGRARQLGGTLFEQALLLYLDAVAHLLARRLGITNAALARRHANLE